MRAKIPSTQALIVFEVAAKNLSCTLAAEKLYLTPSAVSKQLQALEDTLGVALFIRRGQHGLMLTEAGQVYLDCIKPAMKTLAEAGDHLTSRQFHQAELRMCVPMTFAERWLLPRFSEFTQAYPNLKIHIDATGAWDEKFSDASDPFDMYVRGGKGVWPGFITDYICGSQTIIVASPALLQRVPPIQEPADLLRFTLFEHSMVPSQWTDAFEILGVQTGASPHIMQWDYYSLVICSAVEGYGLSMVPRSFITRELASGNLVPVLNYSQYNSIGYYLVFAKMREDDVSISCFRSWLRTKRFDGEVPPHPEEHLDLPGLR